MIYLYHMQSIVDQHEGAVGWLRQGGGGAWPTKHEDGANRFITYHTKQAAMQHDGAVLRHFMWLMGT